MRRFQEENRPSTCEMSLNDSPPKAHPQFRPYPCEDTRAHISHIKKLPIELLERVFNDAYPQPINQLHYNRISMPGLKLAAVSRRWRRVVTGMSRFWLEISVKTRPAPPGLNVCLNTAEELTSAFNYLLGFSDPGDPIRLHLSWRRGLSGYHNFLLHILVTCQRWEHLTVDVSGHLELVRFFTKMEQQFPILTSLEVNAVPVGEHKTLLVASPAFVHVSGLVGGDDGLTASARLTSWTSKLSALSINQFSRADVLSYLVAFPKITRLSLGIITDGTAVKLPNLTDRPSQLEVIEIMDGSKESMDSTSSFLSRSAHPNLRIFKYGYEALTDRKGRREPIPPWPVFPFLDLLTRSRCILTSLELHGVWMREDEFIHLLYSCSKLKTLVVAECEADDVASPSAKEQIISTKVISLFNPQAIQESPYGGVLFPELDFIGFSTSEETETIQQAFVDMVRQRNEFADKLKDVPGNAGFEPLQALVRLKVAKLHIPDGLLYIPPRKAADELRKTGVDIALTNGHPLYGMDSGDKDYF